MWLWIGGPQVTSRTNIIYRSGGRVVSMDNNPTPEILSHFGTLDDYVWEMANQLRCSSWDIYLALKMEDGFPSEWLEESRVRYKKHQRWDQLVRVLLAQKKRLETEAFMLEYGLVAQMGFEFLVCSRCDTEIGIAMVHPIEVICSRCIVIADPADVARYAQAMKVKQ